MALKPSRVQYPLQTNTSGIDLLDFDNNYRLRDHHPELDMLDLPDGLFYRLLELFGEDEPATQAVYTWTENDISDNWTQINNSGGYTAAATSLVVDDSLLAIPNRRFAVKRTGEIIKVDSVVYATHTLTVTRNWKGSGAYELLDDDILIALTAGLSELADANSGTGEVPQGEHYNYIHGFSETFDVSWVQEDADMAEGVATVPDEVAKKNFSVRRQLAQALIFLKRGQTATADGQSFDSNGFNQYVKSNVLDLEEYGQNVSWPTLNDWLYGLFDFSASSPTKAGLFGNALFSHFVRLQRDEQLNGERPYFDPVGKTTMLSIVTDEGNVLEAMLDKYGFDARMGRGGDGIVFDQPYLKLKPLKGKEGIMWRQHVEDNNAHVRKDEIWGTTSLKLRHEQLHGIIKGAVRNIRAGLK